MTLVVFAKGKFQLSKTKLQKSIHLGTLGKRFLKSSLRIIHFLGLWADKIKQGSQYCILLVQKNTLEKN